MPQAREIDVAEIAKDVIRAQAQAVAELENRIGDNFRQAVDLLYKCKGRIIVTGMGKPGLIGKKISATLASTGSPAMTLHPAEAHHGDLGIVQADDIIIALSNSGETQELTFLLPIIKKIGAKLISLVGNTQSTLAKYSDVVLDVSVAQEACSLGIVPTSSTTAALVMGDALAVSLYERKGFKLEDFAFFHPGGTLGKRLLLKVSDVMRTGKNNPIVSEEMLVKDVLINITHARAGAAIMVDSNGRITGIFTDGDLRRALDKDEQVIHKPVKLFMTRNPKSVVPDMLAVEAVKILKEKKIDELAVVDESFRPVGLLDEGDVLGL
ncbi:KpsF/GutQ family sugar-phosphate isomerase [bacterium]|nr:KpsF/GutQ family sugar-phosphate isomerase [bacterium]MCP5462599.1 KpsF/GutQ family sugar-phosphate isomerase [bacterium]